MEREEIIQKILNCTDEQLAERNDLPEYVLKDSRYLERTNRYVESFLDDKFDPLTTTNLEPTKSKQQERYPPEVFKLAEDSWVKRATKPDPAKHNKHKKSMKDGQESVVTLHQVALWHKCHLE